MTVKIKAFDEYGYYPTLRTRNAELNGLKNLDDHRKNEILPLITLGKWPKADGFAKSAEKASEAMDGGPFVIDLPDDVRHHTESSLSLLDSNGNYRQWIDFVSGFENVIPIVQTGGGGGQRNIVQQARYFEERIGRLAFRIRNFQRDTPLVISALSGLDDVENAIVFVDAQYIRSALPAFTTAVTATINALRTEIPETIVSVLSTSFPSSRMSFCDASKERGAIEILEHELIRNVGGRDVAIYGDYGSIHAVIYDDRPIMRWSPTIDYPLEYEWLFERRSNASSSAEGYSEAARAILAAFPEIENSNVWGDQKIFEAAQGADGVFGAAPQSWIAVRVNLHLTRQIDLSHSSFEGEEEGIDF